MRRHNSFVELHYALWSVGPEGFGFDRGVSAEHRVKAEPLQFGGRRDALLPVGDLVVATDPETGETAAKAAVATITSHGQKNLVEITVDTDGNRGDAEGGPGRHRHSPVLGAGGGRVARRGRA